MKNIVLFDPSQGTLNLGDYIINDAIMEELSPLLDTNFVTRFSTHTPILHTIQQGMRNSFSKICADADLKFLGGTNLIKTNLLVRRPDWNVNPVSARLYANSIGVGLGARGKDGIKNYYTRLTYKRVFSSAYTHSCRDERSVALLSSLGFQAINTGCPTMWSLTSDHCSLIDPKRASKVIFTVTDYARNRSQDLRILRLLQDNYSEIYVWPQGSRDYEYLKELKMVGKVKLISPNLKAYREVLRNEDVDYVGTRLHAGIYAMRHLRRTIILAVDHRALDIQATFNINAVPRADVAELRSLIENDLVTNVKIDTPAINTWKSQFRVGNQIDS